MIPTINVSMNSYSQENTLPLYPVDMSRDSTYVSVSSGQGMGPSMDLDQTTRNHKQEGQTNREGSAPQAHNGTLAVPKPNCVRATSLSQKHIPIIHNTKFSRSGPAKTLLNTKATQESDHSSSKHPAITAKEKSEILATVASEIATEVECSRGHSKQELELVIRTRMLDLFDPNKKGKRSTPASPRRGSPDPENPHKCPRCTKRKRTQCDLKYTSISH